MIREGRQCTYSGCGQVFFEGTAWDYGNQNLVHLHCAKKYEDEDLAGHFQAHNKEQVELVYRIQNSGAETADITGKTSGTCRGEVKFYIHREENPFGFVRASDGKGDIFLDERYRDLKLNRGQKVKVTWKEEKEESRKATSLQVL